MADLAEVYGSYIFHPGKLVFDIIKIYTPLKQETQYYGNGSYTSPTITDNYLGWVNINMEDLVSFEYKVYPAIGTSDDVKRVKVSGTENSFTFPIKDIHTDYFIIVWPTVRTLNLPSSSVSPWFNPSDLPKTQESKLIDKNNITKDCDVGELSADKIETIDKETEPIFGIYYTQKILEDNKLRQHRTEQLLELQEQSQKCWQYYMFMQSELQNQLCNQEDVDKAYQHYNKISSKLWEQQRVYKQQDDHKIMEELFKTGKIDQMNIKELLNPVKPDPPEDPTILEKRMEDFDKQTQQFNPSVDLNKKVEEQNSDDSFEEL